MHPIREFHGRSRHNSCAALSCSKRSLTRERGGGLGWGTGKVLLGAVETTVGVIGIIVPEPGTTGAGVVVTVLGVNTVADGLSQLAGANKGHGYNILGEGAVAIGSATSRALGGDPQLGEAVGKGIFLVLQLHILRICDSPVQRLDWRAQCRFRIGRVRVSGGLKTLKP